MRFTNVSNALQTSPGCKGVRHSSLLYKATNHCRRACLITGDALPIYTLASLRRDSREVLLVVTGLRCVAAMLVE